MLANLLIFEGFSSIWLATVEFFKDFHHRVIYLFIGMGHCGRERARPSVDKIILPALIRRRSVGIMKTISCGLEIGRPRQNRCGRHTTAIDPATNVLTQWNSTIQTALAIESESSTQLNPSWKSGIRNPSSLSEQRILLDFKRLSICPTAMINASCISGTCVHENAVWSLNRYNAPNNHKSTNNCKQLNK